MFDEGKANHVCRFVENLPHTKGDWAGRGETIKLEPWQAFILCCLFGWLKVESRKRRFNLAYIAVPRKNGKSILGSALGLYMLAADGEFGSQVFSGATTEEQAWYVFEPALQMVQRTADLAEAFGIVANAKSLFIPTNGSRFKPIIGKPGDGGNAHCAIVDEYHEHDTDALFDAMRTGQAARTQPLLLVITTAGDNTMGPCRQLQSDVEKLLEGITERDELFGIIYTIDKDDDWTSEDALRKANPNYGVSVLPDYLRSEQRAAVGNARKQGIFQTKYLNVWVGSNAAYFNVQRWGELADKSLDPMEFRGLPCGVCVDLSSKIDIAAQVLMFKKLLSVTVEGKKENQDHYYLFSRSYLPKERATAPEYQHYQGWVHDGKLIATSGVRIDIARIQEDTIKDITQFRARVFCFDPWNAEQFSQDLWRPDKQTGRKRTHLTEEQVVAVPQTKAYLSDPMKKFEAAIAEGRVHHDGNPVFTAALGNVVAHEDANDNVLPRKERIDNFIDPAAAAITLFRMMEPMAHGGPRSVYNQPGRLNIS